MHPSVADDRQKGPSLPAGTTGMRAPRRIAPQPDVVGALRAHGRPGECRHRVVRPVPSIVGHVSGSTTTSAGEAVDQDLEPFVGHLRSFALILCASGHFRARRVTRLGGMGSRGPAARSGPVPGPRHRPDQPVGLSKVTDPLNRPRAAPGQTRQSSAGSSRRRSQTLIIGPVRKECGKPSSIALILSRLASWLS